MKSKLKFCDLHLMFVRFDTIYMIKSPFCRHFKFIIYFWDEPNMSQLSISKGNFSKLSQKLFYEVFKITKVHEWLLNMPSFCPPFKIGFPSESRTHPLQSALCTKYSFFSWLYCSTPTSCQEYSKAGFSGSTT